MPPPRVTRMIGESYREIDAISDALYGRLRHANGHWATGLHNTFAGWTTHRRAVRVETVLGLNFISPDRVILDVSYPGVRMDEWWVGDHMPVEFVKRLNPDNMNIVVGHYYICQYHKDEDDRPDN